ncbi:MAG TPA: ATP-binding cassette domain-containing protein [Acidimicrobiales bacterium]
MSTNGHDPGAGLAVRCRGMRKHFGSVAAVDGVDLDVRTGEILGLLGPNGAGKTTAIRVLTTLLPPDGGEVLVFGRDATADPFGVRRLIGYVPQQLSADGSLSGRENVGLFARLFDVPRRERAARTDEVLRVVGLADVADRLASTYSGGMVRRLELAQALVSNPRLLVLDEPTIGLDPVGRDSVWERVHELRHELDMTVLVTTHYMEEADEHCDRVAIMHRGRIEAVGEPGALKAAIGPEATLEDVFRRHSGHEFEEGGDLRDVRSTRRTARRLG